MAAVVKHVNGRVVGTVAPAGGQIRRVPERTDALAPNDVEAEQALLGAILIEPRMLARVRRIVEPEHFFRPANAAIFEAMLALFGQGIDPDTLTIRAELERTGTLTEAGGSAYLTLLLERTPTATHAVHYATVIRKRATERALITAAGEMARSAFDGEEDALAKAKMVLHKLDEDVEHAETGDLDDALADLMAPRPTGWSTGLGVVDHWLGEVGLVPERSLVITGKSGAGKTLLATSMAIHAAQSGARVVYFSLEMSRKELLTRIGAHLFGGRVSRLLKIPSDKWTESDRSAFGDVARWCERMRSSGRFRIYQNQYNVLDIVARARMDSAEVVILDWYQQLEFKRAKGQTADEVDREQSQALIRLCKASGACVVIVSQVNTQGEAKYGAWLNSHAHARLHLENIDGSKSHVKITPMKNRWGGDGAAGEFAEFDADKALGRFKPLYSDHDRAGSNGAPNAAPARDWVEATW